MEGLLKDTALTLVCSMQVSGRTQFRKVVTAWRVQGEVKDVWCGRQEMDA